jgi:hypothetical protein
MKSQPYTVRLEESTQRYVEAEARRTGRPRGQIIAALAEEAVRTRRFPGVQFRGDESDRRAWIPRAGLDVWEIVQLVRDYGSSERVAEELGRPLDALRLAEIYAAAYPAEIEALVQLNRPSESEIRTLYPFAEVHLVPEDG